MQHHASNAFRIGSTSRTGALLASVVLAAATGPGLAQEKAASGSPERVATAELLVPASDASDAPQNSSGASLERPAPWLRASHAEREEILLADGARRVPGVDAESVPFDSVEGALWARGETFKARFSAGAMTYVPFFGSIAPYDYPLQLRLASVTVGGEPLSFETSAEPVRRDHAVEYARGPLLERYELSSDSVEQSFVFAELPRPGDVVVRIDVQTELARGESADRIEFSNELGFASFGRAVAVDAAGRRQAVTTRLDGDAIEIVVPASFAEAAALPLTIDPLVTTFAVTLTTADIHPDVAYDLSNDRFVVVYEFVFSSTDSDIYSYLVTSTGPVLGSGTWIDMTNYDWRDPHVANNNLANVFLVVAWENSLVHGYRIHGRTRSAASTAMGPVFTYADHSFCADVGGDPGLSPPTYFCVVFDGSPSGSPGIHRQMVDATGAPVGSIGPVDLQHGASYCPRISKSNGVDPYSTQVWNVVWCDQTYFPTAGADVRGAQIAWDGAIVTPHFAIGATSDPEGEPTVSSPLDPMPSGGPRPYLVAYQRQTSGHDRVMGSILAGSSVLAAADIGALAYPISVTDQHRLPAADSDGRHFAVAWHETSSSGTEAFVNDLYLSNGSILCCEGHVALGASTTNDNDVAVVSIHSGGGSLQPLMAVWANNAGLRAAVYNGCIGGPITSYCFGDGSGSACPCNNVGVVGNGCASSVNPSGASLRATGAASTLGDTLVLRGAGMPATVACTYFQGTLMQSDGNGSVFGDGLRCAAGAVIRLATTMNAGGASQYPGTSDPDISVRGLVPTLGATRYYQAWYRNAAAFCTSSTFNLSNGLRVVWSP